MNLTYLFLTGITFLALGLLTGCTQDDFGAAPGGDAAEASDILYGDTVAWAVNVGGEAYVGGDGVAYRADEGITGGSVAQMDTVLGSQDPALYRTYRSGDFAIQTPPLANGRYDLTFHFAEPFDEPVGSRVFTVFAEGQPVIPDLDVRGARDEKHVSALTRTVTGVEV
ncbi:MAG: beta-glucanase, partial [Rhodothermaceae bacterium]|nr:beta-glucanase [Rhodothermaceae bacterium]